MSKWCRSALAYVHYIYNFMDPGWGGGRISYGGRGLVPLASAGAGAESITIITYKKFPSYAVNDFTQLP